MFEVLKCRLKMAGDGIVDQGFDIKAVQVLLQVIALIALNHEQVEVMDATGSRTRRTKTLLKAGLITRSQLPTALVPLLEVRQFNAQNGSLQFIEPAVVAHGLVVISS